MIAGRSKTFVRGLASRAQSNGFARDLTRSPKAIVQWLIRTFTSGAFGSLRQAPRFTGRARGARVRLRTSDSKASV